MVGVRRTLGRAEMSLIEVQRSVDTLRVADGDAEEEEEQGGR